MEVFDVTLSTGKVISVPLYGSILCEINKESLEKCLEMAAETIVAYYYKKEQRATSNKHLKRIIFENVIDTAIRIEYFWEYFFSEYSSFKQYLPVIQRKMSYYDDSVMRGYIKQLENNEFKNNPKGLTFFYPEVIQSSYFRSDQDLMSAFYGLAFNVSYGQYLLVVIGMEPAIIQKGTLSHIEIYELNNSMVSIFNITFNEIFSIFENYIKDKR